MPSSFFPNCPFIQLFSSGYPPFTSLIPPTFSFELFCNAFTMLFHNIILQCSHFVLCFLSYFHIVSFFVLSCSFHHKFLLHLLAMLELTFISFAHCLTSHKRKISRPCIQCFDLLSLLQHLYKFVTLFLLALHCWFLHCARGIYDFQALGFFFPKLPLYS